LLFAFPSGVRHTSSIFDFATGASAQAFAPRQPCFIPHREIGLEYVHAPGSALFNAT
jgi:hypothetical protein